MIADRGRPFGRKHAPTDGRQKRERFEERADGRRLEREHECHGTRAFGERLFGEQEDAEASAREEGGAEEGRSAISEKNDVVVLGSQDSNRGTMMHASSSIVTRESKPPSSRIFALAIAWMTSGRS